MKILVNESPLDFSGKTLQDLLTHLETTNHFKKDSYLNKNSQGIAIAINQEVVPKSLWLTTELNELSQVFIFESIAGG